MFDMTGVWDLHVHSGPDVLGRMGDDISISLACKAAGMAGIAVKAHLESTASRAWHTNRQIDGFRYIGGIALNYPVGGINASAVDACLRLGGRIVWLASGHSKFHVKAKGKLGSWGPADMTMTVPRGATGISVIDENGSLTQDVRDVIDCVRMHNAVLASSHSSAEEIAALAPYCAEVGVKFIFTHILWHEDYSVELGRHVIAHGGIVELTAGVVGGYQRKTDARSAVELIKDFGAGNMIISTDAGGLRHAAPHEAMRTLGENLLHYGLTKTDLRTLSVDVPEWLISDQAARPALARSA